MKKLLLISLCLTSINAFADYNYNDYMQEQYQRQMIENQERMLQQERINADIARNQERMETQQW
jgi:hypothetical protein